MLRLAITGSMLFLPVIAGAGEPSRPNVLVLLKSWQQDLGDRQSLTTDKPAPLEFDIRNVSPEGKRP